MDLIELIKRIKFYVSVCTSNNKMQKVLVYIYIFSRKISNMSFTCRLNDYSHIDFSKWK